MGIVFFFPLFEYDFGRKQKKVLVQIFRAAYTVFKKELCHDVSNNKAIRVKPGTLN